MLMMDKYIRVARIYPAILGVLPSFVLLAMCMGKWFPQYQELAGNLKWMLGLTCGTVAASMAVGYLVRELFKETSKVLFQYPLFKRDETEMPTTKMLLWQNKAISDAYHKEIAAKIEAEFGIKLPTREEEQINLDEAKKIVADAVCQIRQNCRGDEILRQYNIEFGFCRNYLGASVWSCLFIVVAMVINAFYGWWPWLVLVGGIVLQLVLMVACYMMLEIRGWAYARCLYATFTGKSLNKE